METKMIKGGYLVPVDGCLGKFQIEADKLNHDGHLPPLVVSHLRDGNTVIDAGAYNGDHALSYSNRVWSSRNPGMIIAVEAGSLAYECLKHNVALFPYQNVFALQAAISDECGDNVSHVTNEDNLGMSLCKGVKREELIEGEKYLKTVTIDYLAQQSERKIDFIKLDIEGWEVKALIGASKTLQKDRPGLLIEVNSEALKAQGSHADEIFEILDFHNYSWEICQPQATLSDPQFDIICQPKIKLII